MPQSEKRTRLSASARGRRRQPRHGGAQFGRCGAIVDQEAPPRRIGLMLEGGEQNGGVAIVQGDEQHGFVGLPRDHIDQGARRRDRAAAATAGVDSSRTKPPDSSASAGCEARQWPAVRRPDRR